MTGLAFMLCCPVAKPRCSWASSLRHTHGHGCFGQLASDPTSWDVEAKCTFTWLLVQGFCNKSYF